MSPASVVVVVGATARRAFEDQLRAEFTGSARRFPPSAWVWNHGELLGHTRYVIALPHPNARVPSHSVVGNIGPELAAKIRAFLRSSKHDADHAGPRSAGIYGPTQSTRAAAPAMAGGRERAAMSGSTPAPRLFPITTRKRDRNGDPRIMNGLNYVVISERTPWPPGAVRVIHVTGKDPGWRVGQLIDLVNESTGLKLERYEVVAGHSGRAPIWDLQ